MREKLGVWPALPIRMINTGFLSPFRAMDNIFAALEHNARLGYISLKDLPSSILERLVAAMQKPFPELRHLELWSYETVPVLPETFLGESAPRLRSCKVDNLPLPALRNLLLSARHLVDLELTNIPHSGYISPEAMVTCLATVPSLESLGLRFLSPRSRPDSISRRLASLARTVLPALTSLSFEGVSEYFEDLISRTDAPLLDVIKIKFFNQLIFDVSELHQFISRTENLRALDTAHVNFHNNSVFLKLSQFDRTKFTLEISCCKLDWQLSSLTQVCSSSRLLFAALEHLHIRDYQYQRLYWENELENTQWLELFHRFSAVENLYLSKELAPRVAPALQELAREGVITVLPALRDLYLEGLRPWGPFQDAIGRFVAMRQLHGHPVSFRSRDGLW